MENKFAGCLSIKAENGIRRSKRRRVRSNINVEIKYRRHTNATEEFIMMIFGGYELNGGKLERQGKCKWKKYCRRKLKLRRNE